MWWNYKHSEVTDPKDQDVVCFFHGCLLGFKKKRVWVKKEKKKKSVVHSKNQKNRKQKRTKNTNEAKERCSTPFGRRLCFWLWLRLH